MVNVGLIKLKELMRQLNFKFIIAIMSILVISVSVSFYLFYRFHREQLIEGLKTSTSIQSELIVKSLQSAMLIRYPFIMSEIVENLAKQKDVESIMVLDKNGTVKISTSPDMQNVTIDRRDKTCQICHIYSPEFRSNSAIFKTNKERTVLRNVTPIFNEEKCYFCHTPSDRINGVLIIDYSLENVNHQIAMNMKKMAIWAAGTGVSMVIVIVIMMNVLVTKRVRQFLGVIDRVNKGDLSARIPVIKNDEITKLAEHFNKMAENLGRSLNEIIHSRDFLEGIIESIDDAIVVIDTDYRIITANKSYKRLYSNESGDIQERDIKGGFCYNVTNGSIKSCLEEPEICPSRETFRTDKTHRALIKLKRNAKSFCYEVYASPVKNSSGEVIMSVEVWRDITDRKNLEAHLIHTEKLASIGFLAAGLSHELNTPLASISTCIDGLSRRIKIKGKETQYNLSGLPEYVELIKNEIDRCRGITDKLRTLSYKSNFERGPVNINTCVKNVVSLLDFEAKKNRTKFVLNLDKNIPFISADVSQLHQVFLNIITNAVQAITGEGIISITTSQSDGFVTINIADSGSGISSDDLGNIFEPFYTKKPPGKGTGLGLFIASNIVKQHDGDIHINSELNQGTIVEISLPRVKENE